MGFSSLIAETGTDYVLKYGVEHLKAKKFGKWSYCFDHCGYFSNTNAKSYTTDCGL